MVAWVFVAADPHAVDPSDVHVIDLAEMQDGLGLGLFGRNLDGFTKPNYSIEVRLMSIVKMTRNFHGLPLGVIKSRLGPSIALGAWINCHN